VCCPPAPVSRPSLSLIPGTDIVRRRHGARLDAADKTWHLTSPTPYDPPLTYGGWSQSKALGQRIASLLHARGLELENAHGTDADLELSPLEGPRQAQSAGLPGKKRRQKIVIHSSPFLRCIQTSTAIAAGISQFQAPEPTTTTLKVPHSTQDGNNHRGALPLSRRSNSRSPAVQPVSVHAPVADPKPHVGPDKILLRVDAFLGEWLSPDYYEDITPPPNSTMMVAGAKADLLRRGDYIELQPNAQAHHRNTSKGHFPGGWVKSEAAPEVTSHKPTEETSLPKLGSLAQALPLRERAGSQGSMACQPSRTSQHGIYSLSTAHKAPDHVYDPPVPSYALSPSDPIPRGYAAHARDACIDVDWQWDSMRAPQEWGDGGEFGDEWSTMHKRFRRGLAGMMAWYREHGLTPPKDMFPGFTFHDAPPKLHHYTTDPGPTAQIPVEEDEDLVLILVTHGAGCNALLGAITNQPVLLDVGMASLSMAVKRQTSRTPSNHHRRTSVVDSGMSEDYEMRIMASLDHLRPGVDPSKSPQPQSPAMLASPSGTSLEYRRRFTKTGGASPIDSPFALPEPYKGLNSSLGSMRRSSTSGSSSSRLLSNNVGDGLTSPTGLWSALRAPSTDAMSEGRNSPGHDFVLNFRDHAKPTTSSTETPPVSAPGSESDTTQRSNSSSTTTAGDNITNDIIPERDTKKGQEKNTEKEKEHKDDKDHHDEHDDVPALPVKKARTFSQGLWGATKPTPTPQGLWGPPRLDEVYSHTPGPKRRWTVAENEWEG
jgi:hypothetical protein